MRQGNGLFTAFLSKPYLNEYISTETENQLKSKMFFGFKATLAASYCNTHLLGNQRIKQLKLIWS